MHVVVQCECYLFIIDQTVVRKTQNKEMTFWDWIYLFVALFAYTAEWQYRATPQAAEL